MSAHALKTTKQDDPLHQFFGTADFLQFIQNPYLNEHIFAIRAALHRSIVLESGNKINLDTIEATIPLVFTSDEQQPARRIFEHEIDRIKNPERSMPSLSS